MSDLRDAILESLRADRPEGRVLPSGPSPARGNQALLMLKPECFLPGEATAAAVLDVILEGVARAGARLSDGITLQGPVLGRLGTLDRHYRLASQLSRGASRTVDPQDRDRAAALCELPGGAEVLGGHELLARRPDLDPATLDARWYEGRPRKVRSGFYVVPFEGLILVNGFFPAQVEGFTAQGRQVVLLVLDSAASWTSLRQDMLGDTYPDRARPGSIRRTLLDRRGSLGLPRVDITANFVHLSAGPFEGAWELVNFFDGLTEAHFDLATNPLCQGWRSAGGTPEGLLELVRRGTWSPEGLPRDLFGDTEELDTEDALAKVLAVQAPA